MDELALRKQIIATALEMNARGLNRGKSGNVSARFDAGFLVTPTGMAYECCGGPTRPNGSSSTSRIRPGSAAFVWRRRRAPSISAC